MNRIKDIIVKVICLSIFGIVGIYLTFFAGNTSKYDKTAIAYRIDLNSYYDSDNEEIYRPIYYFKVDRKNYKCETKTGSSTRPKENKNIVYYDSKNPEKCRTQYEKSTSMLAGIICLIVELIIIVFYIYGKKHPSKNLPEKMEEMDIEKQKQVEETVQKVEGIVSKIQLIVKRVILGIAIAILLVVILIDTQIVKQTIKAKDYVETTAVYVTEGEEDNVFDNYIYTFEDRKGQQQEIIVSISKDKAAEQEIKIKYNENNPQEFYEEGTTYTKSDIIWYIVKIVIMILLIVLFCNKKILNKMNISVSRS